jgi:hypothetical protein
MATVPTRQEGSVKVCEDPVNEKVRLCACVSVDGMMHICKNDAHQLTCGGSKTPLTMQEAKCNHGNKTEAQARCRGAAGIS